MKDEKELKKNYDEEYDIEYILIDNGNYESFLGLDIEYVYFVSAGAQGSSGTVNFRTSDGLWYITNFLFKIEWENLVKVIPLLEKSGYGYFADSWEDDWCVDGYVFRYGGGPGHYQYVKKGLEEKYNL